LTRYGNVGIGTTDPNTELTVNGSIEAIAASESPIITDNFQRASLFLGGTAPSGDVTLMGVGSNTLNVGRYDSSGGAYHGIKTSGSYTGSIGLHWGTSNNLSNGIKWSDGEIYGYTNSTYHFIIDGNDVGIGRTVNPSIELDVNEKVGIGTPDSSVGPWTSFGKTGLLFNNVDPLAPGLKRPGAGIFGEPDGDSAHLQFVTDDDISGSAEERMRITSNGNVGIGTTDPDVAGSFLLGDNSGTGQINTSDWDISTTGDMTNIGAITADGTITFSGVGAGTDNSVLVIDGSGQLYHDEIDSKVWDNSLVDGSGAANQVSYWSDSDTITGSNDLWFDGANVGIGTTSPNDTLHVNSGGLDISGGNLYISSAAQGLISSSSVTYGTTSIEPTASGTPGTNVFSIKTTGSSDTLALAPTGGNVGIGTTDPQDKLEVNGNVRASKFLDLENPNYYIDPANTTTSAAFYGNVGIGTTDPGYALEVNGDMQVTKIYDTNTSFYLDPNGTSVIDDLTADKINANTIDPPYTINGEKFATYVPSMTGVKEETTGQVKTSQMVEGVGYRSIINFTDLEKGSDLWLFAKTIDLKNNIDKLVVLLSPSGNTRTWYELDKENYRLAIYSSQPEVISYRLTAPRFDSDQWLNTRGSEPVGLVVDDEPLTLNNFGDLEIKSLENEPILYTYEDEKGGLAYEVKTSAGDLIQETIGATKAVIGRITAGTVKTMELAADSGVVANFSSRRADIEKLNTRRLKSASTERNEIISPLVETDKIKSDNLVIDLTSEDSAEPKASANSALQKNGIAENTEGAQKTQKNGFGTLLVKGNAEFEGNVGIGATASVEDLRATRINADKTESTQISADKLEAKEARLDELNARQATFSAVYADNIVSKEGSFSNLIADQIQSVRTELEELIMSSSHSELDSESENSEILKQIQDDNGVVQDDSDSMNYDSGVEKEDTEAVDDLDEDDATGTSLAGLAEGWSISVQNEKLKVQSEQGLDSEMVIAANLVINGKATAEEAFINKHLMVGNIAITENTISTLADTLYIQPSGTGKIDFLAGAMTVEEDGTVSINGDLAVAGKIIADEYSGSEGNFAVNLADSTLKDTEQATEEHGNGFGKLLVRGIDGETVMSVDASGSAELAGNIEASGSGTFKKVNIATSSADPIVADSMMSDLATESAELITNATAGEAEIPSGKKEIIIYSDQLTENSLVYITPTTDTGNQVLFVKNKQVSSHSELDSESESSEPTPTILKQVQDDDGESVQDDNEEKGSHFTVAVKETLENDIKFNYWIIN